MRILGTEGRWKGRKFLEVFSGEVRRRLRGERFMIEQGGKGGGQGPGRREIL